MRKRLSEPSQLEPIYDLSAVLIHKGTAVNSGHYIAHIKDIKTSQWWEFDDENVSNLGLHPFGEGSSRELANGNQTSINQGQSSESGPKTFSSSDAYMLMYVLRDTEIKEADLDSTGNGITIPARLSEEIQQMNASYDDACQKYRSKKEKELAFVVERREEVRSVISEAPVVCTEEPYFWISSDWLRQWADNITPSYELYTLHGFLLFNSFLCLMLFKEVKFVVTFFFFFLLVISKFVFTHEKVENFLTPTYM